MVAGVVIAGWICMSISGIFLATQSGINLTLGAHIGKSFAAVVSFATGLAALLIYFAIDTQACGGKMPTLTGARATPWWSWFGGPLGAFYVSCAIIFAPRMGAANALSVFVACQLVMGLILDSFGLAGYKKRKFHWARALGIVLLIMGVFLIAKFDGGTSSNGAQLPQKQVPPPPPETPTAQSTKSSPDSTGSSIGTPAKEGRQLASLELSQGVEPRMRHNGDAYIAITMRAATTT